MSPDQHPGDVAGATAAATSPATFLPWLDTRQRAMLAEMGVRVWAPPRTPLAPDAATRAAPQGAAQPLSAPVAPHTGRPARADAATPVPAAPTPAALGPGPALPGVQTLDWAGLRTAVNTCQACQLCEGRTHAVFGTGHERADWMVVGEAPGEAEDRQGEPYLGAAGRLLDNMLRAVGRSRTGQGEQAAFVTHVLKCRPPTSRNPQPAEVALCAQYLARQVALVQPRVIIALGPLAAQALLQSQEPIGKLRGRVHQFQGVPVIVSFPPSQLLRTPANKGKAWADLCLAMEQLQA